MTGFQRRIVATLVVLAVAAPGLLTIVGVEHDDYPLSTYPMFARPRPQQTVLSGAVLVDADDTEHRLSPTDVSGSAEPLQAVALIDRALLDGTDELCEAIVDRVDPEPGQRLFLVRERVDAVAHYEDADGAPRERVLSVECGGQTP